MLCNGNYIQLTNVVFLPTESTLRTIFSPAVKNIENRLTNINEIGNTLMLRQNINEIGNTLMILIL